MAEALAENISGKSNFWAKVKQRKRKKIMPLEVGGCTTPESIASMWKDKYCKLLNSPIVDSHGVNVLSCIKDSSYHNDLITPLRNLDLITHLLAKLSLNKAAGPDRLTADHLRFCNTSVSAYITIFFNLCIKHGYFAKKCLVEC